MADGNKQVVTSVTMIELPHKIADTIVALEVRKLAPQEGKNSPVTHWVTPIVEVAGSRMPLGRNFQVLFRVRAPQVQGEDKKWTDDPNFPAKLKDPEVLKQISAALLETITGK
jgi:hypothetical protein